LRREGEEEVTMVASDEGEAFAAAQWKDFQQP
jgi:hypothetical protein